MSLHLADFQRMCDLADRGYQPAAEHVRRLRWYREQHERYGLCCSHPPGFLATAESEA